MRNSHFAQHSKRSAGQRIPVNCRLSPAEDDALRRAARDLRCPISALVRHMLAPVFGIYGEPATASPPGAIAWPVPGELPRRNMLAYDPREYMREWHLRERARLGAASPVAQPAAACDTDGRSSKSFPAAQSCTSEAFLQLGHAKPMGPARSR
jgi:hypothetical protein